MTQLWPGSLGWPALGTQPPYLEVTPGHLEFQFAAPAKVPNQQPTSISD